MGAIDTTLFFILFDLGTSGGYARAVIFIAVYLPIILVFATALYLLISKPRREWLTLCIEALLALALSRGVITEALRALFPRERPPLGMGIHPLFPESSASFPSGHATTLFALAGIVYFYDKRLGMIFGAISALICIARVMSGVHYPSDILGGALIALGSAYAVRRFLTPHIRAILSRHA
jgi:undecaprenyl-diphosphatase